MVLLTVHHVPGKSVGRNWYPQLWLIPKSTNYERHAHADAGNRFPYGYATKCFICTASIGSAASAASNRCSSYGLHTSNDDPNEQYASHDGSNDGYVSYDGSTNRHVSYDGSTNRHVSHDGPAYWYASHDGSGDRLAHDASNDRCVC